MVKYKISILKHAEKDKERILQYSALRSIVDNLLSIIRENPFQNPPPYESLVGNLKGLYSRRINRQHRLVYKVLEEEKIIVIVSMWSHYDL